ncbi:MAG: hypothetical protein JNM17_19420, partial [Archangium sp.]|nr:hypothetical protein [Archangium sp.]
TRYTLRAEDLGPDDFPNVFTPSGESDAMSVSGVLQYPGDIDFVPFRFGGGLSRELVVGGFDRHYTVVALDGGIAEFVSVFSDITTPDFFAVEVRGELGAYTIQVFETGVDDHSGNLPFGTRLVPGAHFYGDNIELGDTDLFWTDELLPSHLYFVRSAAQGLVVIDRTSRQASPNRVFAARDAGALVRLAGNANYSLELVDLGPDDFSDTALGAATLEPGVPIAGRLELSTDVDVFTFGVQQNHFYAVSLQAPDAGGVVLSRLDTFLFLEPDGGPGLWRARRSGTQGAQVVSQRGAFTSYQLELSALGADDHADQRASGTLLALDAGASGVVHALEDIDIFAIDAPVGTVVQFEVMASPEMTVRVLNTNGVQLVWNTLAEGNRFGFLVGGERTFVELRAPDITPFSITAFAGSDLAQPVSLIANQTTPGSIDYLGDADTFLLMVTSGAAVAASLNGACVSLEARDPAGVLVSLPTFTASQTGEHRFTVTSDGRCGVQPYTLAVSVP